MSKFRNLLINFAIGNETSGDEHTVLLLHGNDFTDSSQTNLQLTAGTAASISNDGKFKNCLYIDSTNTAENTGIRAQNNNAFIFGTGDFTIDWWMKLDTPWLDQPYSCGILGQKRSDGFNGWVFYKDGRPGAANYPYINARIGGSYNFFSNVTPATGVWEHWALVRSGGTLLWFHNGTITNRGTNNVNLNDTTGKFYIGFSETWQGCLQNAYFDEVRISNVARWTEDFEPPKKPY